MRIECEDMADISIRTPAWGVTIMRNAKYSSIEFQFAPPRGG